MARITGVVDASGAGAGRSPGEERWTVVFTLAAWRVDGGPLETVPLRVRKEVRDEEKDALYAVIHADTLITIDAELVGKDAAEIATAVLAAVLDPPDDPELRAALEELQKPVTVEDAVLGTLTLDRRFDIFRGTASWRGEPIEVTVEANGEDLAEALATAHALWQDQARWHERIRDCAVEQLLELKNGTWLDEDESAVSPDDFRARMKLVTISVDPEGGFEFWHDDGDLFWGHAIEVSGSLEEGPDRANIQG